MNRGLLKSCCKKITLRKLTQKAQMQEEKCQEIDHIKPTCFCCTDMNSEQVNTDSFASKTFF